MSKIIAAKPIIIKSADVTRFTTPTVAPSPLSPFDLSSTSASTETLESNPGPGTWSNSSIGRETYGLLYPDNRFVTVMNPYQINNPKNLSDNKLCNRRIKIFGPKKTSIVVKLTDTGPKKHYSGHLDIPPGSFSRLSNLKVNDIRIDRTMLPEEYEPPENTKKYYEPVNGLPGTL